GALAVGQAQATYDMTFNINRKKIPTLKSTFSDLNLLLSSSRQMLHEAAIKVDINSLDGQPVSLAKANATKTAEIVIEQCIDLCGLDDLLENPWLLKAYRDVFCWEYMEGSTDIQKKHISRDLPKMIKELL
ncbi:MAG: acyl-CoA dehydrogenase family protein, partial [Gammaproteobacteria bacterium]|nr:acyl-CoA dehydrogenase family protein [Gammaproteobacteria bacterium]